MSLYRGDRMRSLNDRGEEASAVTPPLIDRSKVAASLLLRCDHSASISIDVTGFPFPQVTWYLNSRPIVDSPEFRVAREAVGRKHTLVVARVTEELESGLRVKAVNCAGQDQWAFEIKTYKLFAGRSQSDGMKFTTLPLQQPTGRRTTASPKSLRHKKHKRYEMTQDEYDRWQKEMERRSHMRSIDDILDNFSDDDPDTASHPTQNETKSEDNCLMETYPSSSTVGDSTPSPTRQVTAGSIREHCSPKSRTRNDGFGDSSPAAVVMSALMRTQAPCVMPGLKVINETRDLPPKNDIALWEMFDVKLSEFCRMVLASTVGASGWIQNRPGTRASAKQTLGDDIISKTSHPSKPQSRSMPVERKALGPRLVENQARTVYPEKNNTTRIATSMERCGQQETVKICLLSRDPTQRLNQMPDRGGSPVLRPTIPPKGEVTQEITLVQDGGGSCNLRPTVAPKGDTTTRVTQISDGGVPPNLRPPLAPKPSSIQSRQMRGAIGVKDQVSANLEAPGLLFDSLAASLPRHRTGVAETLNSDVKFSSKAQRVQATRPTVMDSSGPRRCTWEPAERAGLLQESSPVDRGQNLLQWGLAVDQCSAEVHGEERRRLEIKKPTALRAPSGEVLETHFNEPLSETVQKIPEAFIANQERVWESPAVEKADVTKADSIACTTGSDVIRRKPPIAKEKPFWSPATGVKGRGIPRANHAVPFKVENVETGLKQNSEPQPNFEPQFTPSKPTTLVRRARSQSSGRSEEVMISSEEETSGYPFGATSAVQLSCSQELVAGDPILVAEQFPQTGLGRLQALAAKSEGLLTTRKRGVSTTGVEAVDQNGGGGREWRGRMPVSKSVDLLDAARNMDSLQRIGRRSLSKEWQVVTVTTKEEITILHRPAVCVSNPSATTTTATAVDRGLTYRPQLRSSKPYAV